MIKYQMKLKVLTPVFIGGGEGSLINKSQYIYDSKNNTLKIIDERKLAKLLSDNNMLDFYLSYVKSLNDRRNNNPNQNNINVSEWFDNFSSKFKIKGSIRDCIKYTINSSNIQKKLLNDIGCFIKNIEGEPYIPGSSIKGSISNAILISYILKNKDKYRDVWNQISRASNEREFKKKNWQINGAIDKLTKEILDIKLKGKSGQVHDFRGMSGISISDTAAMEKGMMKLIQRKDLLLTEKGENKLPIFRECLVSPQEARFSLTIDPYRMKTGLGNDFGINRVDNIFEVLDVQYDLLVGAEGVFRAFKGLDKYLPNSNDEKGYIFLGGGTGYHTKTVMAALAPDYDELLKVVRKLIHRDRPVTFIHKNDRHISPRTLKVSEVGGKEYLNGICKIEVENHAY